MKRMISAMVILLLSANMLIFQFRILPVKAPTTIIVPDDYPSIQTAINAASDGDTVLVRNGTYYENVVVNKSVSVIGESRETTIIDGNGLAAALNITAKDVIIKNLTVQNSGGEYGILLNNVYNIGIYADIIRYCYFGIKLILSNGNVVENNTIEHNSQNAIDLESSTCNCIIGNSITDTGNTGIVLWFSSNNNSISSNLIANQSFGFQIGYSYGNIIDYNNITNSVINGIVLDYSSAENIVFENIIEGSADTHISVGICLMNDCSENTIVGNTIMGNNQGGLVLLNRVNENRIYHNSFIGNVRQAYTDGVNIWDDGYPSGGNYWSDYHGTDLYNGPYQNETGSDGIGDSPYTIDTNNLDRYPLMASFGAQTINVDPTTISALLGQSFNVSIQIHDVSDLHRWVFSIHWNPVTLEFMSVTEGDFLSRGGSTSGILVNSLNQTGGYLEEATCSLLGNVSGVSGDGILATLMFKAKAAGSSLLDIYFHDLQDSNLTTIPSNAIGGNVEVTAPDLSILEASLDPTLTQYVNTTIPVNVTIQNAGTADAGAFNVSMSVYWNNGGLLEQYEEQRVASLDLNMTTVVSFNFTLKHIGNYTLTFKADCDDEIIESNETNNELSLRLDDIESTIDPGSGDGGRIPYMY